MPEVSKMSEKPKRFGRHMLVPIWMDPRMRAMRFHYRVPDEYCNYCPCPACRIYFVPGSPSLPKCVEIVRHRYSYTDSVKFLRNAAAKLEEDRQEKLCAEREAAATSVQALKKE